MENPYQHLSNNMDHFATYLSNEEGLELCILDSQEAGPHAPKLKDAMYASKSFYSGPASEHQGYFPGDQAFGTSGTTGMSICCLYRHFIEFLVNCNSTSAMKNPLSGFDMDVVNDVGLLDPCHPIAEQSPHRSHPRDNSTSEIWNRVLNDYTYDASIMPNLEQVAAGIAFGTSPIYPHSMSAPELTSSLTNQSETHILVDDDGIEPANEAGEKFASLGDQSDKGKEVSKRRNPVEASNSDTDIAGNEQISVQSKRAQQQKTNTCKGRQPDSTKAAEEHQVMWIKYTPLATHTFIPGPTPVEYSVEFAVPETICTAPHLRRKTQKHKKAKLKCSDLAVAGGHRQRFGRGLSTVYVTNTY
ncbi:hypothetical protein BDZ91DRAFT_838574 [Kalaharituber pfeilii]|nr:hypothetical protein BDZ91DRAFT_838574 [Kalaharituber pfeilii]